MGEQKVHYCPKGRAWVYSLVQKKKKKVKLTVKSNFPQNKAQERRFKRDKPSVLLLCLYSYRKSRDKLHN